MAGDGTAFAEIKAFPLAVGRSQAPFEKIRSSYRNFEPRLFRWPHSPTRIVDNCHSLDRLHRCQPSIYGSAKSTLRVGKTMSELSTISVDILVEQRTHNRIRRGL
jgi:hypothetical protein